MHSPIFLLSWVCGLCALWFLWSFGIKKLVLDGLRERLFELRFDLFRLAMSGEISFETDTYRSLEILLNGLLRFAHRITFATFLLSMLEQEKAKREKDYVDTSQQIALKISRLERDTQDKVLQILSSVRTAIIVYMVFSSLFFSTVISLLVLLRRLGLWRAEHGTADVTRVIEREAYEYECRRPLAAMAA